MAKNTKSTKAQQAKAKKPKAKQQADNVVPMEQPQSALHAKVIATMAEGAAWHAKLHPLAIECMEHGEKTGDLRPLLAFQTHLPKSSRKLEFARWVQALGPVEWGKVDKVTGNCDGIHKAAKGSKHDKAWNLKAARKTPFYNAEEAVKPAGLIDAVKQLMAQNAKYEKLIADPKLPRKDGLTDEQLAAQIAVNKRMIAASAA